MERNSKQPSNKKKRYILWGVGAVALGVGGYFLYKKLQEKQDQIDIDAFKDAVQDGDYSPGVPPVAKPKPAASSSSGSSHKPTVVYNQFPLKYGSKGTTVRDLQTALNKKYGTKIDIDGDWGNQTETALKSKGLPTVIDSETYAKLILGTYKTGSSKPGASGTSGSGSSSSGEVSSPVIAKMLRTAIDKNDVIGSISALKKIKDTAKYTKVNTEFKKKKFTQLSTAVLTYGVVASVSKTIVTALYDQFDNPEYRKKISAELYRIGLKNDGEKWSLSGITVLRKIATIRPTQVWDASARRIRVPSNTILGNFLTARNGVTKFVTLDNRTLYVNTNEIRYSND